MDHSREARVGFVVARRNPSEALQLAKEVLDQVTPAVHGKIALDAPPAARLGRNHRNRAPVIQLGSQPIIVKRLVGDQRRDLGLTKQRRNRDAVVPLTRHKDKAHQIAKRVHQRHDLARQTATRAADRLILSPPFAPVPCWWTRTIVASMIAYSKSGSSERCLKTSSKTPFRAHRRKRLKTEFQLPNLSWRSRQGAPVRAIHSTASRKSRLLSPERPGSPTLPGSRGATRCHCSSLRTLRSKAGLRFPALKPISRVRESSRTRPNVNRP